MSHFFDIEKTLLLQRFLNKSKLIMLDQYIEMTKGKKLKTIDSSQFYHLSQKFMKTLFKGYVL